VLTISKLNQYYGGSHILRDVSFEIPKGACTAVLGRNGVGKTTLLKCLVGLVPVRSGSMTFNGVDIAPLAPYERRASAWAMSRRAARSFPA
jgi:urea transport system ATP-binding protein